MALPDDADPRRDRLDLEEQVAADEDGHVLIGRQAGDEVAHVLHALGIEAVGGLVQQQQPGLSEQGLSDAQTLLHAQAVPADLVVPAVLEPHPREGIRDHRVGVQAGVGAGDLQVGPAGHPLVEARRLDERAHMLPLLHRVGLPEDGDVAGVRTDELQDAAHRCGFSRAVGTKHHPVFSRLDLPMDIV